MVLFNETGLFGIFIVNMTNNVTGDIYLTLLTIMFLMFMFFLALRIPIELTAILMLPLVIAYTSESGDWKPIAGIIMLYLGILFGRFFIR